MLEQKNAVKTILGRDDLNGKLGLFGSSFGGTTCLSTGHEINPDVFVIAAAPLRSSTLTKAPENSDVKVILTPEFYKKNIIFDVSEKIAFLKNMIIFHGDADDIVSVESGYEIFERIKEPKKIIIQFKIKATCDFNYCLTNFVNNSFLFLVAISNMYSPSIKFDISKLNIEPFIDLTSFFNITSPIILYIS